MIEVDIKADLEGQPAFGYITAKTEALFAFGVDKVLWILTDAEKIIIATPASDWQIVSWTKDVNVVGDCVINLERILNEQ